MDETKKKNMVNDTVEEEQIPYIKREIDGSLYTVRIHFRQDSRETAKDKVTRLLLQDVQLGNFPK